MKKSRFHDIQIVSGTGDPNLLLVERPLLFLYICLKPNRRDHSLEANCRINQVGLCTGSVCRDRAAGAYGFGGWLLRVTPVPEASEGPQGVVTLQVLVGARLDGLANLLALPASLDTVVHQGDEAGSNDDTVYC